MAEDGSIWRGTYNNLQQTSWMFSQFAKDILDCALYLMTEIGKVRITGRNNPVVICRALSAAVRNIGKLGIKLHHTSSSYIITIHHDQTSSSYVITIHLHRTSSSYILLIQLPSSPSSSPSQIPQVNAQDDNGVVVGNWSENFANGTPPDVWQSSQRILQQYFATKQPVRYGQCWVFAGVLTTICRTLGIPCRPVTNFASAHDTEGSLTVDYFVDKDGKVMEGVYRDSVW